MSNTHQVEARRREVSLSIQAALIVGVYWIVTLYFIYLQKLTIFA